MKRISYENLETEGYLLKEDAKSIEDYVKKNHVMVSFRNAGSATLRQLKRGAATKGHDILDKTIKGKSLGIATSAVETDEDVAKLNAALLSAMGVSAEEPQAPDGLSRHVWEKLGGLVASWKGNVPQALYLSKAGCNFIPKSHPCRTDIIDSSGKSHPGFLLKKPLSYISALIEQHGDIGFYRFFYTGDYDMHDLARTTGAGRSIIPSESEEEKCFINEMNYAIYKALSDNKSVPPYNGIRCASMEIINDRMEPMDPMDPMKQIDLGAWKKQKYQEYRMIRHGAQVNYLGHMSAVEPIGGIVYIVADLTHNEKIAACSPNGGWELLDPVTELNNWYIKNHVKLKNTWKNATELKQIIARSIANKVYREIQEGDHKRRNEILADLEGAIHKYIISSEQVTDEITALTITSLTSSPGARLLKDANRYKTTTFMT